jgi:hypothetical protein
MAWLKQNVRPGEMVANDQTIDAGIWAPYKASVPILLPRSAPGALRLDREPVLSHVSDLTATPAAMATACALHLAYVYDGAQPTTADERAFPDRAALERAPNLEQVFSSGQAAVFRIHLPCE